MDEMHICRRRLEMLPRGVPWPTPTQRLKLTRIDISAYEAARGTHDNEDREADRVQLFCKRHSGE